MFDTLLVAIVLGSAVGTAIVLEHLVVATVVTLGALAVHGAYCRGIVAVDERLLDDRRAFTAFVAHLVLVPLALLLGHSPSAEPSRGGRAHRAEHLSPSP